MNLKVIVTALALTIVLSTSVFAQTQPHSKKGGVKNEPELLMTKELQQDMTPLQVLQKLKDGNKRFAAGKSLQHNYRDAMHQTSGGQYPAAIILSCIDSRTPSEIIFDQNIGDVFNARIAGNFVNTDILGSMEFACKVAGAKLILVVGHSKCGAVKGACDHVQLGNLSSVINEITPAVDAVKNIEGERNSKNDAFVEAVARENVLLAIKEIRDKSDILSEMEAKGEIVIAGAMYDLKTGVVEFY